MITSFRFAALKDPVRDGLNHIIGNVTGVFVFIL